MVTTRENTVWGRVEGRATDSLLLQLKLAYGQRDGTTYGTALWALRLAPTPRLAALRETSILFGLVIATVFLKERLTPSKAAGVGLIAAGAGVLLTT